MKILHIDFTGTFNEEMLYHENLLTEYQLKDGHSVTMLTTCYRFDHNGCICQEKEIDKTMKNGVRLIRRNFHRIICNLITIRIRKIDGVCFLLEQLDPEIIFFHGTQTVELLSVIKFLKNHNDVKLFVDNHADFTNSASNLISLLLVHMCLWRFISQRAIPYTTKFYGTTPSRVDFMIDVYGIPREKIELLLFGADTDKIHKLKSTGIRDSIRARYGFSENEFIVITGGKIDTSKSEVINLVKAVYSHSSDKIRLLIFGSIEDVIHDTLLHYLGSQKIMYLGWLNSDEIIGHLLASDLVVFPGRHSVLWEHAVGAGLPCVFKYWEGFSHLDLGGNCIFLYRNDEDELISILTKFIDDPISLKKMKNIAEGKGTIEFSCRELARRSIML